MLGSHRGGTSLTCQVLEALGVDFGHGLAGPSRSNPCGFYENLKMRQVLKRWLGKLGVDALGQWPQMERDWWPTEYQATKFAADMRAALGSAEAQKDPKMLALWPLAHVAFPDARWLIVRRDAEQIARSCARTSFMLRLGTEKAWKGWAEEQHRRLDDAMRETGGAEVWPDATDPASFRPVEALGIAFDTDRVASVLRPELWGAA